MNAKKILLLATTGMFVVPMSAGAVQIGAETAVVSPQSGNASAVVYCRDSRSTAHQCGTIAAGARVVVREPKILTCSNSHGKQNRRVVRALENQQDLLASGKLKLKPGERASRAEVVIRNRDVASSPQQR